MPWTTRRAALALLGAPAALAALPAAAFGPRAPAPPDRPIEIGYGDHPRQRLDVHPQAGLREAPIVLFAHGGGWTFGDKRAVNALPGWARRHGFLLASTNYRLTPDVTARECAEDVARATAWLLEHGRAHGGDPRRLFLVGHSAGAHLVALVGVDGAYLARHGRKVSDLAGVIPIDGAGYDAVRQMARPQRPGPVARRLNEMYHMAFGDQAAALSPTLLVRPGETYPPYLIFHVAARPDAREQSEGLAAALRRAGGRAEVVTAPGETHRSINVEFGQAADPEGERAARFVKTGRL